MRDVGRNSAAPSARRGRICSLTPDDRRIWIPGEIFLFPRTRATGAAICSTPRIDCWFGAMAPNKAPHGQLVATGPISQWRVGMSLVVYPTKENYDEIAGLAEKGQPATSDTSRPITIIPTWISGPEPGDKESGEDKSIEIMMRYRTVQGETGTIVLTYWTPMSPKEASLPPDQRATIAQIDQQVARHELPRHSVMIAAIFPEAPVCAFPAAPRGTGRTIAMPKTMELTSTERANCPLPICQADH
jgi:hypothetical protein